MFTRQFWMLTAERALKTFAQTLAGLLVVGGVPTLPAHWTATLATAGAAALVSVLTSVGSLKIGPANSPSLIAPDPPAETAPAAPAQIVAPEPVVSTAAA
jgi:Putative lactococcus lactis phage r1t holin